MASVMIEELFDFLFDSLAIGGDQNLIFDGQDWHYPTEAYLLTNLGSWIKSEKSLLQILNFFVMPIVPVGLF